MLQYFHGAEANAGLNGAVLSYSQCIIQNNSSGRRDSLSQCFLENFALERWCCMGAHHWYLTLCNSREDNRAVADALSAARLWTSTTRPALGHHICNLRVQQMGPTLHRTNWSLENPPWFSWLVLEESTRCFPWVGRGQCLSSHAQQTSLWQERLWSYHGEQCQQGNSVLLALDFERNEALHPPRQRPLGKATTSFLRCDFSFFIMFDIFETELCYRLLAYGGRLGR